jgi:hypothetical protein
VGAGRAAIGPGYDPDPDDPRLPVPVSRPARSRRPLAVAAVTAGVLIAAAAVAAMLPITDAAPPVAAPSAAAPPEVVPSSATRTTGGGTARATGAVRSPAGTAESARTSRLLPPTGVTLRDARDSVTLQWTYPAGAEGPVLISGGRTGQQRRAFQQLPAGSVDYVVYGLNQRADYCFTVAVVYSADDVATAGPVCTSRG